MFNDRERGKEITEKKKKKKEKGKKHRTNFTFDSVSLYTFLQLHTDGFVLVPLPSLPGLNPTLLNRRLVHTRARTRSKSGFT